MILYVSLSGKMRRIFPDKVLDFLFFVFDEYT